MKKSIVAAGISLAFCASSAFAAEPPTKEESWTGIVNKDTKSTTDATFTANGKTYPIEGKKEAELLKHDGQKVTITGWMKKDATGKETIDVARFEPAGTTGTGSTTTTNPSTH